MGCHGGFSLDETTRRSWYNPEAVLEELGSGMAFVDVGCGDGFFSLLAAKKVGGDGKVYAVDIDPAAIEKLKQKAEKAGLKNIRPIVGRAEDTVFCSQCADIVFYSMDLHDFGDSTKALLNAKQMMKPNGRLIDLDWKKQEMLFGPPFSIRFSEKHAADLMRSLGFSIEEIKDVGPYHYLIKVKL